MQPRWITPLAVVTGALVLLTTAVITWTVVSRPPDAATPRGSGTSHTLHFTAVGDFGTTEDTDAVLAAIAEQDPDLNLALGDFSYGRAGQEQPWCDRVIDHVGADLPFQLLAGNHEDDGPSGSIDNFAACLPNRLPGLVGSYGREWYVDMPAEDPIVRFVMISPNLTFSDGTWDYVPGTVHYDWTAATIDGARSAGIPWVVVGMHKPCLSIGEYGCEVGADLLQLLIDKDVDLVLSGHEHHYTRTYQLGFGEGCAFVPVDDFDPDCVRDGDPTMAQGGGTVFATVGTGGIELREMDADDSAYDYFAAISAANRIPSHGLLDVRLTTGSLEARFVSAGGGTFTDAFTIERG